MRLPLPSVGWTCCSSMIDLRRAACSATRSRASKASRAWHGPSALRLHSWPPAGATCTAPPRSASTTTGWCSRASCTPTASPTALWRVRAARIVLATGAIERPLTFPDNDRPGVMSAHAALAYLHRHGVRVGDRVVVATNNSSAAGVARALAAAGAEVTLIDNRERRLLRRRCVAPQLAGVRRRMARRPAPGPHRRRHVARTPMRC